MGLSGRSVGAVTCGVAYLAALTASYWADLDPGLFLVFGAIVYVGLPFLLGRLWGQWWALLIPVASVAIDIAFQALPNIFAAPVGVAAAAAGVALGRSRRSASRGAGVARFEGHS